MKKRRPSIPSRVIYRRSVSATVASGGDSQVVPSVLQSSLQQALFLHQQGHLEKALPIYEQLLQAVPSHVMLQYKLATLLLQQGKHAEAVPRLRSILTAAPLDLRPVLHSHLGMALRALGHSEQALVHYDQAISLRDDSADIWNNQGNVLRDMGQSDRALQSYTKAISCQPDYVAAYINRAALLRKEYRWAEALVDFNRALELDPENVECRNLRFDVLYQLHLDERAFADAEYVLAKQPDNPDALNNYGNWLLRAHRYDEALIAFRRAEMVLGRQPLTCVNQGNVLLQKHEYNAALVLFNEALALDSDYAPAYGLRGRVFSEIERHKEAEQDFHHALALEPKAYFIYTALAGMHGEAGFPENALRYYNRALALAPADISARCGRAAVLARLDNIEASVADISYVLQRNSENPQVRIAIAGVYRQLGQLDRAVGNARIAIDGIWKGYRDSKTNPARLKDSSPPPMRADNAGLVLLELDNLLQAHGIPYFLAYGTLLGIYRDGDLLPFDKDMDIGLPWHVDRRALIRIFESSDIFQLHKSSRSRCDEELEWQFAVVHRKKNIAIDLFFFKPEEDGCLLSGFHHRPTPLLWRFTPIRMGTIRYRGVDLPAPFDPECFLKDIYGDDWRIPDPYFDSVVSGRNLNASCRDTSRTFGYLRLFKQMKHHAWRKAYGYAHQLLAYEDTPWLRALASWLDSVASRREALNQPKIIVD